MRNSDLLWLWPSVILTALIGVVSTALMHVVHFTNRPSPTALTSWFGWMVMASGVAIIIYTVKLMRSGEERPTAILKSNLRTYWPRYAAIALGAVLGGFSMYFFMILKPELDVLFPFWADPYLANLDHAIFRTDPWRLFAGVNLVPVAWVYGPFWFFSMLLTLFWVLLKPASEKKATAIIAYFLVWSVFGTVGQALFSSGGPIFFERLGYGPRFAHMPTPSMVQGLSNYLWMLHHQRSLAVGAGISAMPSLHIASMTWIAGSFAIYRSRWTVPAVLLGLFIYAASVALGWHYAVDGIAGALGAACCFYLARLYGSRGALAEGLQTQPIPVSTETAIERA